MGRKIGANEKKKFKPPDAARRSQVTIISYEAKKSPKILAKKRLKKPAMNVQEHCDKVKKKR